jgi:hypothetical protein
MKKWLVSLAVVLALAASGVAEATPTVSGHTGYVDSSFVAISGAGFTTGAPTIAYFWNFEDANPDGGYIGRPSEQWRRKYPDLVFGTATTNRFWNDAKDTTGSANEPFGYIDPAAAKFGSYGLRVEASNYAATRDSLSQLRAYFSSGADAGESAFFSAWFKIVAADTTMLGTGSADAVLSQLSLVRFVGQAPMNNFDIVRVSTNTDSLKSGIGFGTASAKYKSWALGKNTFATIANGAWHRLDAFIVADGDTTAASGKALIYMDYALMDSSITINWPRKPLATHGWYAVDLCPVITEDAGRNLNVYWDDIYVAGGPDFNYSGTPTYAALARVEFQDKSVFGNATERYVQFPVSWGATAIVCRQTGGFDATDKVYVMPVPSGGDLLLQADTCLYSLQSAVPVLGSAAITTAATTNYPGTWQTLGWTDTADNGLLGRDSKKSKTIIDWGDGTTTLLSAAGDTTAAHNYSQAGTFAINVTATNAAGSTTKATSYEVYSNRTRFLTASGSKVTLPAARDPGQNQATVSAASACRVKTWKSGTGDVMSWPIAAGVPWTITDFDSLASSTVASGDTVWVHVW